MTEMVREYTRSPTGCLAYRDVQIKPVEQRMVDAIEHWWQHGTSILYVYMTYKALREIGVEFRSLNHQAWRPEASLR